MAVSRLQAERPDGNREQRIQEQWKLFIAKHGLMVNQIPDTDKSLVIEKLKLLKNKK